LVVAALAPLRRVVACGGDQRHVLGRADKQTSTGMTGRVQSSRRAPKLPIICIESNQSILKTTETNRAMI
jgi:hypothetical protein